MKKHCVLISAAVSAVVFAAVLAVVWAAVFTAPAEPAEDYIEHLGRYFQEFKFDRSELTIRLPGSGIEYWVVLNDLEPRTSLYGESIVVKKNDTLVLSERGPFLEFSNNRDLIRGELAKAEIKGLEPFSDIIFYVKEVIDLRCIGRELRKKRVLIFLTETLSEDNKRVLLRTLEDNHLTVNASGDRILWTEFNGK